MIKVATDPAALRVPFRRTRAVDRDAASSSTGPLRTFVEAWFGPRRLNLALFEVFSVTGLLLVISGVCACFIP